MLGSRASWSNGPLTVYHGTVAPFARSISATGINLARCRDKSDFGRGFYMTSIFQQAVSYANQRFSDMHDEFVRLQQNSQTPLDPEGAAVVEFSVSRDGLGRLDTLVFIQPSADWLNFVRHCRIPNRNHKLIPGSYYDVVYGPLSVVGSNQAVPDSEQISFHTNAAISLLQVNGVRQGGPTL